MEKCREIRAYEKKIKKADAKKNKERANFLIERRPTYLSGLLRIIKERFVKFFSPPTKRIKYFVFIFIAHNNFFPLVPCYV